MPRYRPVYRPHFRRRPWGSRRGFLGVRHSTFRSLQKLCYLVLVVGVMGGVVFFAYNWQENRSAAERDGDSSKETTTEQSRYPNDTPLDPRAIELAVIKYTNLERAQAGLTILKERDAITQIARAHSENMLRLGFEHDLDGQDPTDRALAAGFDCTWANGAIGLSENIYMYNRVGLWMGDRAVEYEEDADVMGRSLVNGWMESAGHRQNILDRSARLIGVGIVIDEDRERHKIDEIVYATQNFSGCSP